ATCDCGGESIRADAVLAAASDRSIYGIAFDYVTVTATNGTVAGGNRVARPQSATACDRRPDNTAAHTVGAEAAHNVWNAGGRFKAQGPRAIDFELQRLIPRAAEHHRRIAAFKRTRPDCA